MCSQSSALPEKDRSGLGYAPSLNHVGVVVGDLDQAIEFYTQAIGFDVLGGPATFTYEAVGDARSLTDVFGERYREVRMCWLATGGVTGFELFQFIDPPTEQSPPFQYWKTGLMHVAVTVHDVDIVADRIVAHGGVRASQVWRWNEGHYWIYCRDPWGNIVELNSMSYERVNANRGT